MSKAKRIGTAAESAVVKYMIECGYVDTKRVVLHGTRDEGDIHINCDDKGLPEIILEVKSRKDECTYKEIEGFMKELEAEAENTWGNQWELLRPTIRKAYLVVKRPGKGKVEDWWLCWREHHQSPITVRCRLGDYFRKEV